MFILSSGVNTLNELRVIKNKLNIRVNIHYLPLGNSIDEKVKELILEGTKNGDWILLENLHLVTDWLLLLEKLIQKLNPETTHPNFRLWMSSMPVDYFPVSFLQSCQKITLQPAKGIKQNAIKLLNSMPESTLEACSKNEKSYKKLVYALCVFHATVVERKKFGQIGWNRPYEFADTDFFISMSQLQTCINSHLEIPFELIQYLIGKLNYGGKPLSINLIT